MPFLYYLWHHLHGLSKNKFRVFYLSEQPNCQELLKSLNVGLSQELLNSLNVGLSMASILQFCNFVMASILQFCNSGIACLIYLGNVLDLWLVFMESSPSIGCEVSYAQIQNHDLYLYPTKKE
jgi:hypothetical protein